MLHERHDVQSLDMPVGKAHGELREHFILRRRVDNDNREA